MSDSQDHEGQSPHPRADDSRDSREALIAQSLDRYWRSNLRIMRILLLIWAVVSLGCGVIAADWLNQFRIGGYPLGFWFAHQGAIVVFVVLILVYCLAMNRLDRRHHEELRALGVRPAAEEERDAGAGI